VSILTKAGRYELREELGRGAMGVVYRAHDPVIGRDVAVKTLHLTEAGTGMSREELVGRFQTEARAAGLLTHPNITVVFDAGEEEGIFYITMELVEGRSLQTMLDGRQSFPLPRVMKLMEQVSSALDFAHQRNVVHRDIKPANLMLTADDTVKITDFGTAKILQFGTAQTSHVMGTPSYMSPEQVKGKPVDGRSDIFSLGVILYELMTGEKPFPGQNITTVIYKIINEDPIPPRSLDPSIHPGLSAVITHALAKEPSARFQTCQELLDALKNYHEIVSPEATVRMSPASNLTTGAGAHPTPQPVRASMIPLNAHMTSSEAATRPFLGFPEERKAPNAGSRVVLTLILLCIIGYAGYRVWPPVLDIWQRMHQPAETTETPVKSSSVTPAANSGAPETKSDDTVQTAPAAQNAAPVAAEESPASTQSSVSSDPKAPAKIPEPAVAPAPPEIATPPPKPAVPFVTSAANSLKSTLGSQLAGISLAGKVKLQVTGNTLTLSGLLTPRDHSKVLTLLHNVPGGVRVIDNIGFADDQKETPRAAEGGWAWIRSTPPGAKIFVDGNDRGLRTPARVQVTQGGHEVVLSLPGFVSSHRSVVIQPGQNVEFSEELGQQ
jgi:serine/threonine protein kinase